MAVYIEDGVNVNAGWTESIAVSSDGNTWSSINKHQLDVNPRWISQSNNPNRRHPAVNKGEHALITVSRGEGELPILVFDPNDVVNQPTWQGNTPANLQAAVADITTWIG
jgi:hypothetical protein